MEQVGLRALKNRLSEYVRRVRRGARLEVTDRGAVVAELIPPGGRTARGLEARLAALELRGILRSPEVPGRGKYPRLPRTVPAGTAQRLLDKERGAS
jgi:prevent-host-death family protein